MPMLRYHEDTGTQFLSECLATVQIVSAVVLKSLWPDVHTLYFYRRQMCHGNYRVGDELAIEGTQLTWLGSADELRLYRLRAG